MKRRLETAARRFFRANMELSSSIGKLWPHSRYNPFREYASLVAGEMQRADVARMADIGAGPWSYYASPRVDDGVYLVGVDISKEAMAGNTSLDEMRVADAVHEQLPFEPDELDLIVSSSVLEHLRDLEQFVEQAARVLRPGGGFINIFPSRYAFFAIVNRILPHGLKRSILHFTHPRTVGTQGFPAYYDRCYYTAFAELLKRHGFEIELVRASYYGSSPYFSIFVPAYLVALLLEMLTKATGRLDLCTTLLVVARKRDAATSAP
jgi:SAM-dependent methyltransferase